MPAGRANCTYRVNAMLKYKLDSLDGLDDSQKALYEEKDGGFQLKVEGLPENEDVSGLKSKVEQLLGEKKAEADARKKAEAEAKAAAEAKAQRDGDYESLSKTYKDELDELKGQIAERDKREASATVHSKALEIAAELADGNDQKILSRFISDRLRHENGEVKVVDADGNLTAMSHEQLREEVRADPQFASLVVASRATGGGAGGTKSGGAANNQQGDLGGDKKARTQAIAARFPELEKTG